MVLGQIRVSIAEFLRTQIIDTPFLFLNLWHVIHFINGFIAMFFISKLFKDKKIGLFILGAGIVLYEILEQSWIINYPNIFGPENGINIFYDLVMAFLGGLLYLRLRKKR